MTAMVERAMEDGAFGLSSALIYMPGSFASTEELIALAKVAGRRRGIYVSHIRGESFNLFNALDEALRIGREGELPVVIFHLKVGARANWGRMGDAAEEAVRRRGRRPEGLGDDVSVRGRRHAAGGGAAAVGAGRRHRRDAGAAGRSGAARPHAQGGREDDRGVGEPAHGRHLRGRADGLGAGRVRPDGGGEAPERDCGGAQGRPVGRALRGHQPAPRAAPARCTT